MNVYKLLSEIDPGTQDVLDMPTPAWLDREYPYVPPPGTDCALKELEYLISLIPERGKWSAFIKDADEDMQGLFVTLCSELGVPCDRKSLDSMVSDAVVLITKMKWLYNRPRPYQVAAKHGIHFTPMGSKTARTPAYPSGHTIQAYLLASRLSERAPQHRKAFMKLAHLISYSRMVGGYHWPSDITFGKDVFRHAVMPHMPSSVRVASKYKDKKEVPKSDGKGTTTVYEYGPRQVAKRHKDKAVRIEALRKKMGDLRQKARGDLTASDPETRLTALAVCLMDETYERVGNEQSAKDGHYGVTNWTADHITLSDKAATIRYIGKSGVKHEKRVTNARVLAALRKALKGKGKGDKVLCDGDECSILAKDVNAYLKPYGITAKDIRGLHANEEMKHHLKAQRKAGPADLPNSRKEKDKILKAEFQAALDLAAAAVGHEASTLRSQYLVPSMEDAYVHDGTVIDKLDKKASSLDGFLDGFFRRHPKLSKYRRLIRFRDREQGSSSGHGEARQHGDEVWVFPKFWTHQQGVQDFVLAHEIGHWVKSNNAFGSAFMDAARSVGVDPWDTPNLPFGQFNMEEAFADSFASYYTDGDVKRRYPEWTRLVEAVVSGGRTATLSDSEREDREDEAQVRQSPKKKPPRTDKERRLVKDRDNAEDDPDEKQDRKDRSTNFKDASARVALRFLLAQEDGDADGGKGKASGAFIQFMEEEGDTEVNNPDTGNKAKVRSLRGPKGRKEVQRMFQDWLDKKKKDKAEGGGDGGDTPTEEKAEAPATRKDAEKAIGKFLGKASSQLKDLDDDEILAVAEILEGASDQISESLEDPSSWSKILQKADGSNEVIRRVGDDENPPSPKEIAEAIIASRTAEMMKDPNLLFSARPLDQVSLDDVGDDMSSVRSTVADRAVESLGRYQALDKTIRDAHRESLEKTLKDLEGEGKDNSERYAAVLGQYQGLVVASVLEDGDDARGVSPTYAGVLRAAQAQGRINDFVRANIAGAASGDETTQAQIRKIVEDIDNDDLVDMIPEDSPAHGIVSALANDDYLATMDQESQDMLRQLANDFMLDGIIFADADLVGQGKTVREIKADPTRRGPRFRPAFKALSDWWDEILAKVRASKKASVQSTWDFTPWPSVLCVSSR